MLVCLFSEVAFAQDDKSNEAQVGRLLRVRLPITGSADLRIMQSIDQLLDNLPNTASRPTLVFEFAEPIGNDKARSDFGRCLALAQFLTSNRLSEVRTVAYIPGTVTSHAVLVAMACEEIVVAEDAVFGEAGRAETSLGVTMRGAYKEIAEQRRTVPVAVALGMLDKELQVYEVTTNNGVLFVLSSELEHVRAERTVRNAETIIRAGELGRFRGDKLRKLGFASYVANDRTELSNHLKIPAENLEFDPSLGGTWRAVRVELNGPVTATTVDRIMNSIQQQQELRQVNFISFDIRSEGGAPQQSIRLANFLADLDRSEIRTVAYVAKELRSDAALIAFASDHIVVKHNAVIGGDGAATIGREDIDLLKRPIQEIGEKKSRHWSVASAMIDPDLQVFEFQRKDDERRIFVTESELLQRFGENATDDERPDGWVRGGEVTSEGEVLKVDGNRAHELGFARFVVIDGYDELKQIYQLEETPELVGPNWAYELVEILASPEVAGGLLFIGIFALYIEISSPGLGIGGFISTVCFVLYFWANFMHGTAEVLEILLFVLGVICLLLEIFVLPGFGIFGLGGGILVLGSLILATQTFIIPTNEYQMNQLPKSLMTVIGSFAAVLVCLVLLRKHIHRAPILGSVMLNPPEGDDADELNRRESLVDFEYLLGQIGVTSTRLSPAGKAMFQDELVDVVSDGELVQKNERVRVIQVFGNRIVVESID